jgi:phage shock protein A
MIEYTSDHEANAQQGDPMSIITRIQTLISANLNAMIDAAEDPQKMVEEYLRQMRQELEEARAATALAMADETRLQARYQQAQTQADDWQHKAELAVRADDDALAREALTRKRTAQTLADSFRAQWQAQHDQVADLRDALARLEAKIAEAEAKRDLIIAKLHRAQTQEAITDAVQNIQDRGADQSLERLEERADDRLAQAQSLGQLTNQSLDQRFSDLETQSAVDSDLAALKQRLGKG